MRSDALPLSRSAVDRDGASRADPHLIARLWSDPRTRVVLVHRGLVAVTRPAPGECEALDLVSTAVVAAIPGAMPASAVAADPGAAGTPSAAPTTVPAAVAYLGRDDDAAYVSYALSESAGDARDFAGLPDDLGEPVPHATWASLRQVGAALCARDAGLAATAVALAAWHARHPRCPRCGEPTRAVHAGWARECLADGTLHHPRTDPAIIVAVRDASDRLLLAHAATWPERRYSLVAGYVEPGESIEAAVRREVAEECGLRVTEVAYEGSQPWPFPASLMLGFRARALAGEPTPDGEEVTAARFVTRDELPGLVADGDIVLPMRASIARALIEEWFGGTLPGA